MKFTVAVLAVAGAGTCLRPAQAWVPVSYTIHTVAGSSAVGDGGPALAAALSDAEGVAVDSAGNLFIADAADHRVRKVTLDGNIATVAGDGFPGFRGDGGPASAARLNTPYGIAIDQSGTLYIADLGNNRVRKVTPDGAISTVAGTESLLAPRNLTVDSAGTLFISEFGGARVRRIRAGGVLETVAGTGTAGFAGDGGAAQAAQLSYPAGLALDAAGTLYIADSSNHRIRKVVGGVITTVLGTGTAGADLPAQLNLPTSVAMDALGNLYVSDSGNQRVQQLTVAGTINTLPGSGRDLALDRTGNLFLASGPRVTELAPSLTLQTVAGDGSYQFRGDGGEATSARLNAPVSMALGSSGGFFIADQKNSRVRWVNPGGVISTAAGDGTAGSDAAQLSFPSGVAVTDSGAVYVSDQNNDRIQELASGGAITLAGTGVPGFNGDGLPATATQLFSPGAITFAGDGTIYFVDSGNARVRAFHPGGTISTVAKIAAGGTAADNLGNVYITDLAQHRVVRVDPSGLVTVMAGTGTPGFGGDGGPATSAQLNGPKGLAIDAQGNVYIADAGNHRIRMIGPDEVIATIAGTGTPDFDGDSGPALSAALSSPAGLALDTLGNVYVADTGNNRIRMLTPAPVASQQSEPLGLVNAASMIAGPVVPGEIVSIFGIGLGPITAAQGTLNLSGVLATEISGTRVLFAGFPAPLFYAQDTQVNAQAPYEIAGNPTVDVEVFFHGVSGGKITVAVADSQPGIFTIGSVAGPAVVINQDGSVNSVANPAATGSVITLFATGEGLDQPAASDGKPATAPLPKPVLPIVLDVGLVPAEILYAGAAPGYAGLMQINARVPGNAPSGAAAVVLRVGTAASQTGVTIAVR
jgi:uncharacterized protein (TIGR03437 family)